MPAGNGTIGALRVSLGLDSAQFETGLKRAQGSIGGFGKIAGQSMLAITAAAATAGVAVAASIKTSINAADDLSKASQKIGVGTQALSELKYAAELADVSFEGLTTGLRKLAVNMAAAASEPGGKLAQTFKTIGVQVTDTSGKLRSTDAVFSDVTARFGDMADGAGKTALAVALFGKSGADLIPLLNAGAAGLAALRKEAAELGVVISEQTGKSAEEFNDNLTRMQTIGKGLSVTLAAEMLPALEQISASFVGASRNAEQLKGVGIALSGSLKIVASGAVIAAAAFGNLGRYLATLYGGVAMALRGDFAGAADSINKGFLANVKSLGEAAKTVSAIWSDAGAHVKAIAPKVSDQLAAPIVQAADKVKAGRKALKTEAEKTLDDLNALAKSSRQDLDRQGLDGNQLRVLELGIGATKALTLGQAALAAELIDVRGGWMELAIVTEKANDNLFDFSDLTKNLPDKVSAAVDGLDQLSFALDEVSDAFNGIGQNFDDLFLGLKNRDWLGAASGLVRAAQGIRAAFQSGNLNTKAGAVAAAGQAVGTAVGGRAGGAIAGAASGAAIGTAILPGIGTAIGAVLGGLGGFFGAGKAKKKAKAEAARQAAEELARKAAEEAAQKRQLEIALMEAAGDAAGAQAAREADLLASLSPANAELQKQILALEKEADVRAAAAALAAQQRSLEEELLEAGGNAAAALKMFREDELAALPEALRPLKLQIYATVDAMQALTTAQADWEQKQAAADQAVADAREDVADAAEREGDRLAELRDRFGDLADGIRDARAEIVKGQLSGKGSLAVARAQFAALLARGNDPAALAALPDAARDLVAGLKANAPDARTLNRQVGEVARQLAAAETAARAQATIAQQQLTALQQSVAAQLGTQAAVLSLNDAFAELAAAVREQASTAAAAAKALGDLAKAIPPPPTTASLDAGAAAAAAAAAGVTGTSTVATDIAKDVSAVLLPPLLVIADNTFSTADNLDDVINGPLSLNTTIAA